ncbi:MATE family efflux transporter [Liberiplasma polymorphum]|jgi:putative MATE family efflux protein|uniref:MATE family efflux transporter n=1 Tax=Liberiplasma polymorphum TaxID=3374570 RepID=UPI0037734EA2
MSNDDKKRYLILKDSNIYKGLIILAIPLMLNNLLKTFHDIIDMFFVARIPGEGTNGVAAIQLTFPIMFTFISLGIGLSVAGTALISQFVGSGQKADARKYASQLLSLSIIVGIVLFVLSYFGAELIIKTMGIDPSNSPADQFIYDNSIAYLKIRAFEMPFMFMFFAFMAIRQASGDTVWPVIISGTAIVINTILSPILIQVYGLGVPGAAYATVIANVVIMPFGFYLLFFAKSGITVTIPLMKLESGVVRDIVRTAIPASLGQAITAIGFYLMNGIIYSYGPETVAAFSVGNRISSMILHPVMAIGGVASAYIGQNIGAQNTERAKATHAKSMILSVCLMAVGSAFLIYVRRPLAGIFIVDNLFALDLASEYMFYLLIGMPLMAIFQAFMGTYNGTGNTKYSLILSVLRLWGMRIPLVIFMREFTDLGSSGIWYAILISNFLIGIVGYMLYLRIDFKPKISISESIKPVQAKAVA